MASRAQSRREPAPGPPPQGFAALPMEAYVAAGLNGFVPKPFTPAQPLAEVVRLAS